MNTLEIFDGTENNNIKYKLFCICLNTLKIFDGIENNNIMYKLFCICMNNNNRIQRHHSRFFTISSQRLKLSPTRTIKWPRHNHV